MAIIDVKSNPTRRDLAVFAAIWPAFFLLLASLSLWHKSENSLLYMSLFTGSAFLFSLAFNSDFPRRIQLLGVLIPGGLALIWSLETLLGVPPLTVFWIVNAVGVVGALAVLASQQVGIRLYKGWMFSAMPIGWSVSAVLMGIVYYLVLTPLGLIMRALGRDSMHRTLDRNATTYWLPHTQQQDHGRYFRQF